MTLGELIDVLKNYPKDKVVKYGFCSPHSYRGYYEQLAFEPTINITVGQMLESAEGSLFAEFEGYKGGDFFMNASTDCWLSNYGSYGVELSERLLYFMLEDQDKLERIWTND